MAPKRKAVGSKAPDCKKLKKDLPAAKPVVKPDQEAEIWFSVEHW